jgi:hypothetical protein
MKGFFTAYHYACWTFNPIDARAVRNVIEDTTAVLEELDFQRRKEEQKECQQRKSLSTLLAPALFLET